MNPVRFSNATKAQIVANANAVLVALPAFGILTDNTQMAAVVGVFNACAVLFVGATFKLSPLRRTELPSRGHL